MVWLNAIIAVIIVSLIPLLTAIPFFTKFKVKNHLLLAIMSLSVGTLLGGVFLHFIPETIATGYTIGSTIAIIFGFLTFFLLEKLIHFHHNHKKMHKCDHDHAHSHGYQLAPINLIGDGLHNFLDGLVIAASFAINIPLGIAASISIILHELPQEIADMGILIYSGMSAKKALMYNALSGGVAIIGTIVGLLLVNRIGAFSQTILPFTAGVFLYIAASNLVPELHKECGIKDTIIHILAILIGFGIMIALTILFPTHAH